MQYLLWVGDVWPSNRRYKTQLVHLDLQLFEFQLFEFQLFAVALQKQRGLQRLEAAELSCPMLDVNPRQNRAHSIAHVHWKRNIQFILLMLSEQTLQLQLWLPEAVHDSGVGVLRSLCRLAAISWG